jgi:hypothetical protein
LQLGIEEEKIVDISKEGWIKRLDNGEKDSD